jgi:ribose 5-phosphate isomerase
MALSDITFGGTFSLTDQNNFILDMNRGNIGTISSIETDNRTSAGSLQSQIPASAVFSGEFSQTYVV